MKTPLPPPLALRASRWRRRFLWVFHALAALTALTLPQPWMLLALGWVGASCCCAFWPAPQLCELSWLEDGRLGWRLEDGCQGAGRLLTGSLLTPHFWLLQVDAGSRRLRFPVWFDAADPQDLRRWRVDLRWRLSEQQGDQQG